MITLSDIRDIVSVETPISEDEITNPIYKRGVQKSLELINMHRPRLITGTRDFESNEMYKELNIKYLYPVNYFKIDRLQVGLSGNTPNGQVTDLINYRIDYTFESLYDFAPKNIVNKFEQLVCNYCMVFAANKRRSAVMSELPFDLKGDDFYNEATEKIAAIEEELINSSYQILE